MINNVPIFDGCRLISLDQRPLSQNIFLSYPQTNPKLCLTVTAFPHPCILLWSCTELCAGLFAPPDMWDEKEKGCEFILSQLWHAFKKNKIIQPADLYCVTTFQGPGPYTRLRSGRAFASGMAVGWGVPYREYSFFDLYDTKQRNTMAIHTGIDRWILDNDDFVTHRPPEDWHVIASSLYTMENTITLMERLYGHTLG